ncbi:hypothetical protein [Sporisorium scitamineum]|uniref:Uncharacterized protein n=1 Tax=Sporisorium scitamineum TaxID=49012 RepID=A0A0F7RY16_9BASI|nr:hypothetical protein [Sporisorium scitamineum]
MSAASWRAHFTRSKSCRTSTSTPPSARVPPVRRSRRRSAPLPSAEATWPSDTRSGRMARPARTSIRIILNLAEKKQ